MLYQCAECGHNISGEASRCPHCGLAAFDGQSDLNPNMRVRIGHFLLLLACFVSLQNSFGDIPSPPRTNVVQVALPNSTLTNGASINIGPFIPFLQPFATLLAAVAVGFFAYQQWRVTHDKLRFDLFDRRYRIYEATRKFLISINNGNFTDQQLTEFYTSTSGVEFLFGEDVEFCLEKIRQEAIEMRFLTVQFSSQQITVEKHEQNVEKHRQKQLWLYDQIKEIKKLFEPYLGYKRIRNRGWMK